MRGPQEPVKSDNSPLKAATSETPLMNLISAEAGVSAVLRAGAAPLTVNAATGSPDGSLQFRFNNKLAAWPASDVRPTEYEPTLNCIAHALNRHWLNGPDR
jgi:hypothetical protein